MELKMNKNIIFFIASLLFLLISCKEDNSTEPEKSIFDIQGTNGFIGKVNGTDAFIVVMLFPAETIAYICNGEENIHGWFWQLSDEPEIMSMTSSRGAQLNAEFDGNYFVGEVTLENGNTHSFTAAPSNEEDHGLFLIVDDKATDEGIEGGWIVNQSGEVRGALVVNSSFQTTPSLQTSSVSVNGSSFQVLHVVNTIDGRWGKAG